jgi:DNA-binding LacI/PurR family transcriptional regulator
MDVATITMTPTLRDIAAKLHVAPSTVSRALSGDHGVGESRAAEICALAKSLGYRPRPLRRLVNHTIGIVTVTPDGKISDEPYQTRLLAMSMETMGEAGWHMLHEFAVRTSPELPAMVRENLVDGIVFSGMPSPELCKAIRRLGIPAISFNDVPSRCGLPCISANGADSMRKLVDDLFGMGHRNIAYVSSLTTFPSVAARADAFEEATRQHKIKGRTITTNWIAIQQGQAATRQIMARKPHPTAVIYSTDRLAVGGLIEFARLGLSIPSDISVAAFDNTGLCASSDPAITCIDLNQGEMVARGFEMLRGAIESGEALEPIGISVDSSITWRSSCTAAP